MTAPKPHDPRARQHKIVDPRGDDDLTGRDGMNWTDPLPEEQPVEALVGTHCVIDGKKIEVMAFRMTGVCSELCRKLRDNEITREQYDNEKAVCGVAPRSTEERATDAASS